MKLPLDRPTGKIVLADGTRFDGYLVGAGELPVWGEVVFNTSMTGYQEVITDPSYAGQIVVMTYPQIGNYGVTYGDSEKARCAARALVVREISPFFSPGPSRIGLEEFMKEQGLPGLGGVDTRAITRRVRAQGSIIAAVGRSADEDALLELARSRSLGRDERLVAGVSGETAEPIEGRRGRAAVIDLGIKRSILDHVRALGVTADVLDSSFRAADVLGRRYDFVVVSNGPGDPADIPEVTGEIERMLGRVPMLGICLGHQVIARALGAETYKLKFGHHGGNQPVVDRRSGRVLITSQNHNYAVKTEIADRPGVSVTYVNANDGTLEGFVHDGQFVECVQFHPEGAPGPHDTRFIFDRFYERVKGWRRAASS